MVPDLACPEILKDMVVHDENGDDDEICCHVGLIDNIYIYTTTKHSYSQWIPMP
jgi:hypothetical protein